jgi:hypothetical protein
LILTLRCIPMSSSSKSNASPKAGSASNAGPFPNVSPEVAAEIAYLMRTPGALSEGTQRPGGRGHYDPNQPRVPAGDPKGGQFASKGYRGGDSGGDTRVMQASFDGTQLAQLGQGNPRDALAQAQLFGGVFGHVEKAKPEITYQPNNPEGWGGMQRIPAGHLFGRERTASRFYPTNADCAAVKLDIWIDRGMMTYTALNNPNAGSQAIEAADEPGRTTMLLGEKNCRVRVLIERADISSGRSQ